MHSQDLLRHQRTIQREKRSNAISGQQDCKKDNLTSHQRVRTSDLALNKKRKSSEAQLSPKRINLLKETQEPSNLKWKITHQESVTPSKHPRLENIIDPGDVNNFQKTLKYMKARTKHTPNFQNYPENYGEKTEQLKQLTKPT